MACQDIKLSIFVASRIGSFKHVYYNQSSKKKRKDSVRQLQDIKTIEKGDGISCMTFVDPEETEILLGRDNRIIQKYNLLNDEFTQKYDVDFGEGKLHSLSSYGDTFIAAVQSGIIRIWNSKAIKGVELNAGPSLEKMRHCMDNINLIGTGGKENDLKIWDLETQKITFQAKNVPHDWLQLRVPIWVSDICFLPETDGRQVAICSRYGTVRLYDARTQRRPVCSVEFQGQANTCISAGFRERQVLVGTGRGFLQMVDLRGPGKPDKSYKGATGAVTAAVCLPQTGVVVSTSLDRHLMIHNAETKDLLHKQYMTTKLTALLVRSSKTPLPSDILEGEESIKKEELMEDLYQNIDEKSDSEYEEIFNNMEVVGEIKSENSKKKKSKIENSLKTEIKQRASKRSKANKSESGELVEMVSSGELSNTSIKKSKKKKKLEILPENSDMESEPPKTPRLDESIKLLLKSTEKRKKEMERKKQEKKRKSVFNC